MTEPDIDVDALSLGEVAYRRIRADILACRLAPSQRLTERGLAATLDMGVSPIRDALTRLDNEGLVRTIPRKGYQVKPLTMRSVDHIFEYWSVIVPEITRHGVAKATPAQLEQFFACLDGLAKLTDDEGPAREAALSGVQIIRQLFLALSDATGNEYLIAAHNQVVGELARIWTLVLDGELLEAGRTADSFDEWREALVRRDADTLADITRRYVEKSHTRVLLTLARWPSVSASEIVPIHSPLGPKS